MDSPTIKSQLSSLITKWPRILLANPDKTLLPKLQFFHGLGIPGLILTKIVSSNPCTLTHSLKNQIIPSIDYIKSYVHTNEGVIYCIQWATRILQFNVQKVMEPKIRILRDYGIPKSNISRLIMIQPKVLILSAERLNEIVSMVKEMGLNPSSGNFILAIKVKMMSRLKWERKVTVYRSCGWSEDEFLSAFKLQPYFMGSSEYKIKRVMSFFTNEMGWKPSDLSRHPNFLLLSLEKRIVPRCSVLKILMSKGLVKDSSISTTLTVSNEAFIKRFIAKYQDSVPEIPTVYQGKMGFLRLDVKSEDAGRALKL